MMIPIDKFLGKDEVRQMRGRLDAADWQDGAKTAGALARAAKKNLQLDDSSDLAISLGNTILRKLGHHALFISAALPGKIHPPRFNRYSDGGNYGMHVDAAMMQIPDTNITMRSDLSVTLFLSEPDEYDGGELEIVGPSGMQAVKLAAGDMILYPSSSLHRVNPVTRGTRIASFFWIQSMVREDSQRGLLFDLDMAIIRMTQEAGGEGVLPLTAVYHNLLRMWAEP
jgi:PKHD-type hydroxylase